MNSNSCPLWLTTGELTRWVESQLRGPTPVEAELLKRIAELEDDLAEHKELIDGLEREVNCATAVCALATAIAEHVSGPGTEAVILGMAEGYQGADATAARSVLQQVRERVGEMRLAYRLMHQQSSGLVQ